MPRQYSDFEVVNNGSQRAIVKTGWGPAKVPRALKIDMTSKTGNPKTEYKLDIGYGLKMSKKLRP